MTKTTVVTLTLILTIGVGAPLMAGYKKCPGSAQACVDDLVHKLDGRGWIGIEFDSDGDRAEPVIKKVLVGGPAAAAGVAVGDRVLAVNDVAYAAGEKAVYAEFDRALHPGNTLTLKVERDGKVLDLKLEVIGLPEQIKAQWIGQHMLAGHAPEPPEVGTP